MRVLTYGLAIDKIGGIETFLLNMNRFLQDGIIFDYIIDAKPGIPKKEQDTIHRAAIEACGSKVLLISPKRDMLHNLLDWYKLLKEQRGNTDVVYFNLYSLAWIFPVCLAKLFGYRVVIHAHNNNLYDCSKLQRFMHKVFVKMTKHMNVLRLTNSELSSKFFFDDSDSVLIYNAIDTSRFQFDENKRKSIRRKYGLEGRNIYGFVGRVVASKNPLFLMDVFSEISKLDEKAVFLVCGDGNMMADVQKKATALGLQIVFTGAQQNVQDYYSAMDVFVLPSLAEGLGLVLIEAQCGGLPSITSADVVPQGAKVTELLDYFSLEKSAADWAKLCVQKMQKPAERRESYAEIVCATNYEIRREAVRLGEILTSYKAN